ncbi:UNVERIFIED_ORG: GNAT superfamily N-acetyltransferase [Sphingomonas sp. R1F5B]
MTIEISTDERLGQILDWLRIEDQGGEITFHPNRNMITNGHDAGELLVLKEGDEVAAFALGAPGVIDIFETKPAFRRSGEGRKLVRYCIERAAEGDMAVIEVECAPSTSLPFWKHMGFQEIRARHGHNPWVGLRVPKPLALPDGQDREVVIRVYDESVTYLADVKPVAEYRPQAVLGEDGAIYLEERVALYAPDIPPGNNVAVEIIVQGARLGLGKAKRDELEALGVRHDPFRNFYIDVIYPTTARGK